MGAARRHVASASLICLLSTAAFAQNEAPLPTTQFAAPTLSADQPVDPAASSPGGPIIQSITARAPATNNLVPNRILAEFHFVAPKGNAVLLHLEQVKTSANHISLNPTIPITIPAEAQQSGGIITSGFTCGTNPLYLTLSAFIMDADGNRSNAVQYTVHCNGG